MSSPVCLPDPAAMDFLADLLAVFGRTHPMLLHLPIGLLVGLGVMEWFASRREGDPAPRVFVVLTAVTAFVAAASGWMLHEEEGYGSSVTLERHEWLGIATMAFAIACCVLHIRGKVKAYRISLGIAVLLLLPTGHLGAEMTHGKGFLLEPFGADPAEDYAPITIPTAEEEEAFAATFTSVIEPILHARCTKCHGSRKVKGELRLDTPEHIRKGGEGGAVLAATAEEAELYRRLLLPLDHDDHMPPESKTQLVDVEIELLRLWLDAGAPFEGEFDLGNADPFEDLTLVKGGEGASVELAPSSPARDAAFEAAVTAVQTELVHVAPVEPGSAWLVVSFAAVAQDTDDAMVERLLAPLSPFVQELSLSRTRVTDVILPTLAAMPELVRLDLGRTLVQDEGLRALEGHPRLERLSLYATDLTDASADVFQSLPNLRHIDLWSTAHTPEGLATLRTTLADVTIDAGDSFEAEPLEVEPELVFTGDAPLVDAPPEAAAPAILEPINSACPVSGKSIDPRYTVVHAGRVIGFCCPNCPKTFWDDPSAYAVE